MAGLVGTITRKMDVKFYQVDLGNGVYGSSMQAKSEEVMKCRSSGTQEKSTAHLAPTPRGIKPAGLTECDSVPALQPGGELVTGPTKEPVSQGSITGPTKDPVPQGTKETPQVAQ